MADDFDAELERAWSEAMALEPGPAKIALLEEALRLADTHQDLYRGYELRMNLIDAATFSGFPDKALVAFSWCLAQCERNPDQFYESDLLWKYKWVAHSLGSFPQIPRSQVDAMLQDLAARFERCGAGMRAVHMLRWRLAQRMGQKDVAKESYVLFKKQTRDWMADCHACEQEHEVEYAVFLDKDEKALQAAEPILNGGMRCMEVPHTTYGRLLLPLVRLGRLEEAARYHATGYRMMARKRELLETLAGHMTFLAVTDNLAKALKMFEKHLIWALESTQQDDRFSFFVSSGFVIARLAEAGKDTLKLRLPHAFPLHEADGKYETQRLHDWLAAEAKDLATRFDERNGNDHYARLLRAPHKWRKLVTPHPL